MNFEQNSDQNIYIISLHGKLISPNEIEELHSHFRYLREQNITRVVLNLESLDWMASNGLGALISCVTTMRNAGGDVRLSNLNPKLKSLVALTHLDKVFNIFESSEMAVQSFFKSTN